MVVFPVTSYPVKAFLGVVSVTTIVPLFIIAGILALVDAMPGWLLVFSLAVTLGFLLSVTIGLSALLVYVATRNEVSLRNGILHIKGGSYHQRVAMNTITEGRIVNLDRDKDLIPLTRENGLRLPGYRVGWYQLRNHVRAFVLLTARKRAVYLETNNQFAALLGVKKPEKLLEQIQWVEVPKKQSLNL